MSDKTPFEKEIDDFLKTSPADVLKPVSSAAAPQFCSGCGARRYLCWCGQSRLEWRSDYPGDRR